MLVCHETKGITISKTNLLYEICTHIQYSSFETNLSYYLTLSYLTQNQTNEYDRVGKTIQITVPIPCNYR